MKKEIKNKSNSRASVILGIIGVCTPIWPYIGFPLSILAVYFGMKCDSQAGKVLGIIGIVLNSVMIFVLLLVIYIFSFIM